MFKMCFCSVVEWLAPPEHSLLGRNRLSILKKAATEDYTWDLKPNMTTHEVHLCPFYRMEMCKKYVCHPPTIVAEGVNKDTLKTLQQKN